MIYEGVVDDVNKFGEFGCDLELDDVIDPIDPLPTYDKGDIWMFSNIESEEE